MRVRLLFVVLLVVLAAPSTALAKKHRAVKAKAEVAVAIDAGTGLVQPTVKLDVRGCRGHRARWSSTVALGSLAPVGDSFHARGKYKAGKRVQVRLKFAGRFSEFWDTARGTVRGKVVFRGKRKVTCALPKLSWTAQVTDPAAEDEDAIDDEGDDVDDGEYDEDDGDYEDDPGDDEGDDPGDDPDEP
jgi:hypothetical protein